MPRIDLSDASFRSACHQAVLEVLETMFFELPLDSPELRPNPAPSACCVTARFGGSLTGAITLVLTGGLGHQLAASFLGLEDGDPDPSECRSVAIEMTNVLCGATMSRIEPAGRLRIEPPELAAAPPGSPGPWLSFALESGRLDVHAEYTAES
jgi:hypothetical protein